MQNEMLKMLEETANSVAACTGIKQQFIDAGWDEHNAEQMVIAMLANAARGGTQQ